MLITKLITLKLPWDPEWDSFATSVLGNDVHAERKTGFILSRMALSEGLKEAGVSVCPDNLTLENYRHLKSFPQFTISLSHTKGYGAALLGDSRTYQSVGIDIEREERPVKDMVIQRVSHPEDLKLRNIELWCLKEAAYKALMNSGKVHEQVGFSSLRIGDKLWSHSPSGLSGEWELESANSILLAKAFLLN